MDKEEKRSITNALVVVLIFFDGVYLLNYFGKLNFDNVVILAVLIFAVAAFWGSHHKRDINEVMEFEEPTIKKN